MSPNWVERKPDDAVVAQLEAAGYPRLLARLLALRGISAADEAARYLSPSLADLGAMGMELPGMKEAADEVFDALREKKQIVVYGDYDCDGVAATAIVMKVLEALDGAADVQAFIPHRTQEGFGLTGASVERLVETYPHVGLVITVDNGTGAAVWIRELQGRGIRCVVTDHHLPEGELPACPIVNPKVCGSAALSEICGAAVAFFLASYLVQRAQAGGRYAGPKIAGPLLVLAGLATVTDVMPLVGVNRILVAQSLRLFNKCAPIGLRELYARTARVAAEQPRVYDYGFGLGPRVNAVGRLASATMALDLIREVDREAARELARQVDLKNAERKEIEKGMIRAAVEKIVDGAAAQVIYLPEGHLGVAGIVAAAVINSLKVPAPVCIVMEGGHGSARAPKGYNVHAALGASSAALSGFGGHASAAGLTVKEGELERFRELFCQACAAQREAHPEAFVSRFTYEAEVTAADLSLDLAEEVNRLEPFGADNGSPVFLMRGVEFTDARLIGTHGEHLEVYLDAKVDGLNPRAIWWKQGAAIEAIRKAASTQHDILFRLSISDFGARHLELTLVDISL